VNRLEALEAFKIVRAPFDGIVTARNTDIGARLIRGIAKIDHDGGHWDNKSGSSTRKNTGRNTGL
jgi:hypothetical protein